MSAFLSNPSILTPAKKGENSIFLPILSEIFDNLVHFGECGEVRKNFEELKRGDKKALSFGSIVLVADDLKKEQRNYEEFSKLIPYKYDTFNQEEDTNETIKKKINVYIEKICDKAAVPKFDIDIQPDITNLVLVSFFGIKLQWRYLDIYKTEIDFCNNQVDGFCIPAVPCAARIYKDNYLLVRIPVNCLSQYPTKKKENEIDNNGIINFIEPWKLNQCDYKGFSEDYLYLTMVMKASENLRENSEELAELKNDKDPEDLCKVGEDLITDSLLHCPTMNYRTVALTMPNVETSVKFKISDDNNEYVKKGIFDKKMVNFAEEKFGRNLTLDSLITQSEVKINNKGVIVSGSYCSCCTDSCSKREKYILTINVPFVYTLSVGKCIVASGIHNK